MLRHISHYLWLWQYAVTEARLWSRDGLHRLEEDGERAVVQRDEIEDDDGN